MNQHIFTLLLLSIVVFPLQAEEPSEPAENPSSELRFELTPEQRKIYESLLSEERRGFVIPPKNTFLGQDLPERSGEWIERDGVRVCDGYLTRIEDDEFCSATVPSDWEPFEFEGQVYFVQPLADNDR